MSSIRLAKKLSREQYALELAARKSQNEDGSSGSSGRRSGGGGRRVPTQKKPSTALGGDGTPKDGSLLEAEIHGRIVRVQVTLEPGLDDIEEQEDGGGNMVSTVTLRWSDISMIRFSYPHPVTTVSHSSFSIKEKVQSGRRECRPRL